MPHPRAYCAFPKPLPMASSHPVLDFKGEIGRKALHLLALVVPLGMLAIPFGVALALLSGVSLAAIATEIARSRSAAVAAFVDRWFGWMMRPEERGMGRGFTGATWVVVTATLLLLAFDARIAATAMSMALVGDAAAALAGRTWGRTRWPGSRRTVLGTGAFLLTAMLVAAFFPWFGWSARGAAALAAATVEVLPIPVNDNLSLPFAAAAALALLGG